MYATNYSCIWPFTRVKSFRTVVNVTACVVFFSAVLYNCSIELII